MSEYPSPRKRKQKHPENYKQTKVKIAKLQGMEYITSKGKTVAAKRPGFDCK